MADQASREERIRALLSSLPGRQQAGQPPPDAAPASAPAVQATPGTDLVPVADEQLTGPAGDVDDCALCQADVPVHEAIWKAYAQNVRWRDAMRVARSKLGDDADLTPELIVEHMDRHHYVQPGPPGKSLHRDLALHESMSLTRYELFMLRAVLRAGALSQRQLFDMFYLGRDGHDEELATRMDGDLRRLMFRSFLYRHWPENRGALTFQDPGPFYYLGRQSIPVIEKLEGMPAQSLDSTRYVTSFNQINEFDLEQTSRFMDVIAALRSGLYHREFSAGERRLRLFFAIEHWFGGLDLATELKLPDGSEIPFRPGALVGLRVSDTAGALDQILPLWVNYDRGVTEPAEAATQLLYYAAYYQSPEYREKFPRLAKHRSPGPLLGVCETVYRREDVQRHLSARLAGRPVPIYLTDRATLLADPWASGILTCPSDASPDQRYGLLDRVLTHGQELLRNRVFTVNDSLTSPVAASLLQAGASGVRRSGDVDPGDPLPFNFTDWGDPDAEPPPPPPEPEPRFGSFAGGRPGRGGPGRPTLGQRR